MSIKRIPKWRKLPACSFIFLFFLALADAKDPFRAGAVATDISPKTFPRIIAGGFLEGRGDKLTSPLHSRAIVLDDGKMKIAFAIVDTCMMEQKLIDEAKTLASKQCGIPVDRMMVSATHTHSAPAAMGCLGTRQDPEYAKFLIPKIAESIVEAHKRLQPAKIGWGSIDDWEHTHNRRWIRLAGKEIVDPFGKPTGRANMHPGYLSKDVVGPSGPVDPQLSVISIQTKDGKPLAVLANYSQHYFGNSPVSADYFGIFCDLIEKHLGGGICAMSQGTSGDLMWMDYGAEKKNTTIQEYSEGVASYAKKALAQVKHQDHAELGMIEKQLTLKYRTPDKERLTWAQRIAAQIQNDVPKDKQEVYAREAVILDQRKQTTVKLQAIRIGDLSITTLPNEVYAITGLKLRKASRAKMHFNIELANGAEGYIPPPEQHLLGGYTTWPARTAGLEVNAEPKMVEALCDSLFDLLVQDRSPTHGLPSIYVDQAEATQPLAHYGLDEFGAITAWNRINDTDEMEVKGAAAWLLPGVGSGIGYDDESELRPSVFTKEDAINRSIHLAGGHIETSKLKLGDKASIALWFWLGHESGASDRSGHLIDALGATLVAHQFADHTVQLEWSAQPSVRNERLQNSPAQKTVRTTFADDWHSAVLIRDGDQLRVHLDGSEKPILTGKAGANTDRLIFGQGLQGRLDEITVWDRAIEPKLIAQLWKTSKVEEDNARHAAQRAERAQRTSMQKKAQLKQHENWSVSMRFRNTKKNNASPVTAYLISRGPKGDPQAPGDHLGIGGNYKDSEPGKLFVFNGNAASQIARGRTVIEPDSWNNVTFERAGSHVRVTLNGKVEIDAELPVTAAGAKDLFFGRRSDDFAPLKGEIEKVVVTGLEAPAPASVGRLLRQPPREATTSANSSPASSKPSQPAAALAEQALYQAPLPPEQSLAKLHVREGFKAELIACEPAVLDPVAFDWDDRGRLWVAEMADYPLGMDGNGKPGGRVRVLEDTDGDGRYDKSILFADGLSFPNGILTWRDGALITAAPEILFLKDTDDDGKADVKKPLITGFSAGNQQLRVNGLRWGMDGWVYCAGGAHTGNYNKDTKIVSVLTGEQIDLGSRDFRFRPDTGEFDPQSGPSQFGRCRDDWGHWFGVQNSFPLWHYVLQDHYLRRNAHVIPPDPVHQLFSRNPKVYPASAPEKRFHSFDQAGRFTSACGIEVYRGAALFESGASFQFAQEKAASWKLAPLLHAFTCEPFHNLVQHHVLEDNGVTFKASRDPVETTRDVFASEDRWCRPVMVRTGPDGALYIADMYRYMIEHPQFLPPAGKDELLPFYREGEDKGRIYRLIRTGDKPPAFKPLAQLSNFQLVKLIESANGWLRDKAQMMLVWRGAKDVEGALLAIAIENPLPQARAQAAWSLRTLGMTSPGLVERLLIDPSPRVREQGLQIAEGVSFSAAAPVVKRLEAALTQLTNDPDAKVRLQLACSLGQIEIPQAGKNLAALIVRDSDNPLIVASVLSSASKHLPSLVTREVVASLDPASAGFSSLVRSVLASKNNDLLLAFLNAFEVKRDAEPGRRLRKLQALTEAVESSGATLSSLEEDSANAQIQEWFASMEQELDHAEQLMLREAAMPAAAAESAVMLLVRDPKRRGRIIERCKSWLATASPPETQRLALLVLRTARPASALHLMLADWADRTPAMRREIIETALSDDSWTLGLIEHIKSKTVETHVFDAATRARLLQHPNARIKQLAAEALATGGNPSRQAVVGKFRPALALKGDPQRGAQVFALACASCHRLNNAGIDLGPDLRSVVQHDPEKLLNSILDPSAVIEPGFVAYHCALKNGEQLYGIVATETSNSITMKLPGNITRSFLRSEIASLKSTNASLMPDGLEAALTQQSVADLITFLKTPPAP